MKMLGLLCVLSMSSVVSAESLRSTEVKKLVCKNAAFELEELMFEQVEAKDIEAACMKTSKFEVLKKTMNFQLKKVVYMQLTGEFKIASNVGAKIEAEVLRSVSFGSSGELQLDGWKLKSMRPSLDDRRSSFAILSHLAQRLDVHGGGVDVGTFNLSTFNLEEERSGQEDNSSTDDVSSDWESAVKLLQAYQADQDFMELLKTMKAQDKILGAITVTPNEECTESEYCSYGTTTIYFKDGNSLWINFDFNT